MALLPLKLLGTRHRLEKSARKAEELAGVDRQRVMKLFLPAWTGLESVGWREVKYPEMNGSPPLLLC